jgi:hypothetical protein
MKRIRIFLLSAIVIFTVTALERRTNNAAAASAPQSQPPAARVVDLKASDGAVLKTGLLCRGKAGPRCVAVPSDQPDS